MLELPTVLSKSARMVTPELPSSPPPSPDSVSQQATSADCYMPSLGGPGENAMIPPRAIDLGMEADPPNDDGLRKKKKRRQGKQSRSRALLKKWNPTLTLENSGSVARDHLASERTFLAYVRTSMTIASVGVALVQLFTISAATTNKHLNRYSRPLGAVIIGIGLCTLALGVVRYFLIQGALVRGFFPVARISAAIISFTLASIILTVFVILVVVR
ncbi:hypothetical protein A0H81_08545 [Grifola frondosa]|uniref:DUF202 domain-containing protein n=1 Tax=Grifola frondosa TaxID=5627 RepID=A0A1C7M3E8_GRIFR|nr:hypothetical protein A0H81_08545 [Grifola frondosa]